MNSILISNPVNYKVALYIRLSKEDAKKGESESISNQRSILRRFAKNNHLAVVEEYVDDGVSGTTFHRPAFKRMIQDIEDKKINMILTKDLSRLGRDYIGIGHYLEKYFPEKCVRYISLLDGIDTGIDSNSNDIMPFKSILNDMYAKDISNKIKSVKHNKQELGLFIGGKAPFGYRLNKNIPNKLFIDINASSIVKRIFKEACSGKSCRAIAINLTLDNIPTPSQYAVLHGMKIGRVSQNWSDSRIHEIISNEVYIGNMVQGRMKKINYKSKKNMRIPREQWKVIQNTHEPIIDQSTFLKANKMLETRKQTRIKTHDYLLKGLVYCHECGKKLGCSPRKLQNGIVYYFRCSTYTSYTKLKLCTSHSIRSDYVEKAVTEKLKSILQNFQKNDIILTLTEQKINEKNQNNSSSDELKKCQLKLLALSNQIDILYNDKLNGTLSQDDFSRIYNQKKQEKTSIQHQITLITSHLKHNMTKNSCLADQLINKFYSNPTITREILIDLVDRIEIDKNKRIYIFFKFKSYEQ